MTNAKTTNHPTSPDPRASSHCFTNIGRQQLLERLVDTGTENYDPRVRTGVDHLGDLYVKRRGLYVEMGFINSRGEWAQHGVRYRIVPEPPGSPYRIGKWIPISTSDLGSIWGGTEIWVRGQGTSIAKAIWFQEYFDYKNIEVSWSGMTEAEKEDIAVWLKERSERLEERERVQKEEYEKLKAQYGEDHNGGMKAYYYRSRVACRADCGEKKPKLRCSKCKIARYCSPTCQVEDWKYHKTYCGKEEPYS